MPFLFIAIPLAAAVIINFAYKWLDKKAALWVAIGITAAQAAIAAIDLITCLRTGSITGHSFAFSFTVDYFGAVVLFTIGLVSFVSLFVAWDTLNDNTINSSSLILLIMTGMNGIVMVNDLFSLYVFVEITAAASFILISMSKRNDELESAFKYYTMSAVATILLLTSIALIFLSCGGTSFEAVGKAAAPGGKYHTALIIGFILFSAGLAIKSGLVPFHTWVPDAYSASPAFVSIMLAGIVTKASGIYIRVIKYALVSDSSIGRVLIVLGLLSILVGALAAIGQNDMKRMLAYSSISQIGYIMLGIGTGSVIGYIGAILHFFNHATFKSLLFVDSAALEMRTGTRQMDKLGGIAEKMPVTGASSIIAFLSTAGIPPLSGFWSKLLIILAVWRISQTAAIIALTASVITLAYFLVMQKKVFFGKVPDSLKGIKEVGGRITGMEILLSAINILVGVLFPALLVCLQNAGII